MLYLLSDLHGGERLAGLEEYLSHRREGDWLIVLGDTELAFRDTEANRRFTRWFLSLDVPIALVDGNHENFAYLNAFPQETWCGGRVHRLSNTVVHLQRGNVYTIGGHTFFVMGGCKSSPIWKEQGLWYEGEEPSEAELALAYAALEERENRVDYVLTHKYEAIPGEAAYPPLSLEGLTRYIDERVEFRHWYSGHRHWAGRLDERHTVVYDQLLAIEEE